MPTINQLVRKGRTQAQEKNLGSGTDQLSPAPRSMCEGLHYYAQKAELRVEEGRQSSSY